MEGAWRLRPVGEGRGRRNAAREGCLVSPACLNPCRACLRCDDAPVAGAVDRIFTGTLFDESETAQRTTFDPTQSARTCAHDRGAAQYSTPVALPGARCAAGAECHMTPSTTRCWYSAAPVHRIGDAAYALCPGAAHRAGRPRHLPAIELAG